jgi:phosphoesterase RecJ-like protein
MSLDWSSFVDLVRRHQRFLLTTHVRPDGDGLGSMLALGEAFEQLGKECRLVIMSVFPPRYRFLDPKQRIGYFELPGDTWRNTDAVIVLDTGTWEQLGSFGEFLRSLKVSKAVIDHHLTQDDLGATRFIDTTAEATGRLAYEAIRALGCRVTESMASGLFTALAMDTGWFRHSNSRPATFQLAAELVGAGARPDHLYDLLFEQNSPARMKLMGLVLDRLQFNENGKIACSEIQRGDYEATGAVPQDSEDMINLLRGIIGVEVALFFMEQPRGGVKVSFRSRERLDVARLAQQFGGGGHRLAAGATVNASLAEARQRVLDALKPAVAGLTARP